MWRLSSSLIAVSIIVVAAGTATAAGTNKSKNVDPVAHVDYKGGSHLTFGGGFAYGGELNGESGRNEPGFEDKGGVRIFDISGRPRQVGFFHCPGNDHDSAFIKPGLIVVGHHRADCTGTADGVFTLDVSNPKRPKLLGSIAFPTQQRVHAITRYPGKPLVYTSGGGLGARQETVTMVDVSNPNKPKIAGTFLAAPRGCHDFSFHFDKRGKFGICSGLGEVQIWDVSKPLEPDVIARIHNPLIQFAHFSAASADGKLLVINDENITANDCVEEETPTGAIWVYDIADIENPQFLSFFSPPRGDTGSPFGSFWVGGGTCTSHDFNWADSRTVVVPWYTGGFNVVSLKDPENPKEIAFYQPEGTNMWSAHFHKGRIYTNDMGRGFEAVDVAGL